MKITRTIIIVLSAALLAGCARTGVVKRIRSVKSISEDEAVSLMSETPILASSPEEAAVDEDAAEARQQVRFYVNKRFIFSMAWNGINIGRIIAESLDMIEYRGRDAYVMKVVTESNEYLSKIYRVEDTYTSYVDAETMTSMRYEADRKEGNYRKHVVVEYDFEAKEAVYTSLTDGSVKTCSIEDAVQDPLSAICYFMTIPVKVGEEVKITVNLNEKNYRVAGKIGGAEAVKLPKMGYFAGFKVRPYVSLKGKKVKKGKAWMYFSADRNRYPLYGVVLIPFGKVTATLETVEDIPRRS